MRLDTTQHMRLQQKMMLAPRMIQSMEILQLPIMALQERIEQELQENPVLELREVEPDELDANGELVERTNPDAPSDLEKELVVKDDDNNELDFDRLDALSRDWSDHFNEEHRPSRGGQDEASEQQYDAMLNMPSRPQSLDDHLNEQLGFVDAEDRLLEVARFLISHLDDNGYLTTPLEQITLAAAEPISLEEAEQALQLIQKLEPPGVGARDLRECLLLQITPETPHRALLRALIQSHLEDIQHNRLPIIQRRTGHDLEKIQAAIEVLKHLNPRPGAAYNSETTGFVVPDIAVEQDETGDYEVRLLDDYIPRIFISRQHVEMLKDKSANPTDREYLKKKIQGAQWLIDSIEQRRSTLLKVAKSIVRRQRAFLDYGPEHIEPLKMQQVADEVGVHVTTVSRAVDDKWVQTPRGLFPLKRFFGGGTTTASGAEVAWETIKQKLLDIIEHEDKSNPYSDDDLMKKLGEVGYPLARRTVTKYRKMLDIPSSRQRKDWMMARSTA